MPLENLVIFQDWTINAEKTILEFFKIIINWISLPPVF